MATIDVRFPFIVYLLFISVTTEHEKKTQNKQRNSRDKDEK